MINRLSRFLFSQWFFVLIASLAFNHLVIADEDRQGSVLSIKSASYDVEKQRLKVKVKARGEKPFKLKLINAVTSQLLLQKNTKKDEVTLRVNKIKGSSVPCSVTVQLGQFSKTEAVKNAPVDCSGAEAGESSAAIIEFKINDAKYEDDLLIVSGEFRGNTPKSINLYDDSTGQLLATRNRSREDGHFIFKVYDLARSPCRIRVQADQSSVTKVVEHAENCAIAPPPTENKAPLCSIISPVETKLNIVLGESVNFSGTASDPELGVLRYEWDFNGGADNRPTVLMPGNIVFDANNGRFLVHFIVTDEQGARCTADRTIIVGLDTPTNLPTGMVPQQAAPNTAQAGDGKHVVLPANDLGMHCADLGSYPLSILPPFNTVNAHAILKGSTGSNKPLILDPRSVTLKFSAASNLNDPVGPNSINSTSRNFPIGSKLVDASIKKSDFWDDFKNTGQSIASLLFPGLNPIPDEGLATVDNSDLGRGLYMPGIDDPYSANDPQDFSKFVTEFGWFTAQGIPLTPVDDNGRLNSYPVMRIQAIDSNTGLTLATTDVVTPVSGEVDCRDCHTAGKVGANTEARLKARDVWLNTGVGNEPPVFVTAASADRLDVETAAKKNILMLHDFKHGTDFIAQDQPVLCASCHKSNALASVGGPSGDPLLANMSKVMHGFHGRLQTDAQDNLLRDVQGEPVLIDPQNQLDVISLIPVGENIPMEDNCFQCHPGKITQCFRGAMYTAGQTCDSCHGDMLAMGGEFARKDGTVREPWAEEPTCGSCHSGIGSEAVANKAFDPNDPSAEPLPAKTPRFAENANTLYRNSLDGHANLGCESCHGSPHAIWPNRNPDANDNITATQLQGHAGTISECTVCHEDNSFPNGTLNGPHGMHPVNDPSWMEEDAHGHFAEDRSNGDRCAACHGEDHLGTRLSKVPVDRVLKDREGKALVTLKAGDEVACNLCHSLSKSFGD